MNLLYLLLLHRYAYNSCSLYDTCQSCIGSRRYDNKPCIWSNGRCSLSSNSNINDRGCPLIINEIQPMNADINIESVTLTITGSFEGVQAHLVTILVTFPLSNQHDFVCTIEHIQNGSLTCNLIIPKQPVQGVISINIKSDRELSMGDTDIFGSVNFPEKFNIYIPKAILKPDYGPAIGGTKIQIENLDFNLYSTVKIHLGKQECQISKYEYSTNEIECINQACMIDKERLELNIQVNNHQWQLEKTYFQCRANPIIFDWYPKKSIISGGMKLIISGQNLDVVQKPMMKFISNSSIFEFITVCEIISTSQMICLSPIIDKNLDLIPPFDIHVSFIMDNMKIIPEHDILMIVVDPIYYPFEDSIQQINSSNIVQFELHRYAYNSCSLYDTCQSCIGSRRYDNKPCIWSNGRCSLSSNSNINDRGCPLIINEIQPMNADVNIESVTLTITGSFEGVQAHLVTILVTFPLSNQHDFVCTIEHIQNDSLTCNLIIPKQPVQGIISINIKSDRELSMGDTDIFGSVNFPEKFNIYIPKAILKPDYGPAIGGTKIQIENLDFNLYSTVKIYLDKQECQISKYDYSTNEIECINQACMNDKERLELNIQVNNHQWQLEKTYFQCRANPIIFDWYPKKSIISGGMKLIVSGQNLDVVQKPMMKFISNSSIFEFITVCEIISTSQMICLSPIIDKNLDLIPPFDIHVSFIMDNMKIIPKHDILMIVVDPIYYPFEDSIQQINSSNIVQFEGLNLAETHSIDEINIEIDNITNACIPFNFTDTQLLCLLSKNAMNNFENSDLHVRIHVGANLTFSIGKILFQNQSQSLPLLTPYLSRQFGPMTTLIFIVLSSSTILTLLFTLVILTRRRFYHGSQEFHKETKPPQYYQSIWSELGKSRQIIRKNLIIHEKVGQGCFGDVYRGELKQNKNKSLEVAIKVSRDQNVSSMHEFLYEANRMKDFSHRNILSLIGVTWDPSRKAMVLLPYMKNGDLKSYISNEKHQPTVRQLITWAIQVADGMEYLSSSKFVHRDLATRNCMLDEQLICLISDFGLSRDVIDRDYYVVPTTTKENDGKSIPMMPRRLPLRWLSPESIESSKYTIQSDVWSFGVLLWELMSRGKTPYPGIDNADLFTYIKNGYRLQKPTYCPPLLYKSAMALCWHIDPTQRPTFTQLAHDIRHILHQLELEQQRKQSSSADDDDTTIVQRYPIERKLKQLSTTSLSSTSSIGGQYITTPHRQSENIQLLFDRKEGDDDDEDAYAVPVNASAEVFSTTRLLTEYTETSIVEDV
ncbi:unnamed protein product [Adineta steineri]|uniref:receptor protein-tyrosine kinase n=1 Tax=Adineta steineri TaxID=433720 RepID=A0A815K3V7_9BILA|nr:unnamed protein product [Adineta steineri]